LKGRRKLVGATIGFAKVIQGGGRKCGSKLVVKHFRGTPPTSNNYHAC
jgi:hypothetical protein